ncbi:hypothetical protein HZH68_002880 [Vespula germanica]|uniref:Uncharacterized protein n=1 Tax=Vespula germanica TaxID=30212 RepID=A0A834NN93_VESGE|nr:hypothetical protein HZH68_002880 [Vespula germanica]
MRGHAKTTIQFSHTRTTEEKFGTYQEIAISYEVKPDKRDRNDDDDDDDDNDTTTTTITTKRDEEKDEKIWQDF